MAAMLRRRYVCDMATILTMPLDRKAELELELETLRRGVAKIMRSKKSMNAFLDSIPAIVAGEKAMRAANGANGKKPQLRKKRAK